MNGLIYKQKQTYRHQKQTYGHQREMWAEGRRGKSGAWNEHKHNTKYKTDNQQGLYVTGNSTQYSGINFKRKESKKRMNICICITESLCCTSETNTTL